MPIAGGAGVGGIAIESAMVLIMIESEPVAGPQASVIGAGGEAESAETVVIIVPEPAQSRQRWIEVKDKNVRALQALHQSAIAMRAQRQHFITESDAVIVGDSAVMQNKIDKNGIERTTNGR